MNWGCLLRWGVTQLLRHSVRRSLRHSLAGIWIHGEVPRGATLLAPNHASWWDGYLLAELAWRHKHPLELMMTDRQLARFPFLRLLGARGQRDLLALRRSLQARHWVAVFPQGEIRHPAALHPLRPGATWLARRTGAPLVPVALRVVLRAAQWPEAFVRVGRPCSPADLEQALSEVLTELEDDLRQAAADQPPAGYQCLLLGRGSLHDQVNLPSRLLSKLVRHAGLGGRG